jgi:hypothetical protein
MDYRCQTRDTCLKTAYVRSIFLNGYQKPVDAFMVPTSQFFIVKVNCMGFNMSTVLPVVITSCIN